VAIAAENSARRRRSQPSHEPAISLRSPLPTLSPPGGTSAGGASRSSALSLRPGPTLRGARAAPPGGGPGAGDARGQRQRSALHRGPCRHPPLPHPARIRLRRPPHLPPPGRRPVPHRLRHHQRGQPVPHRLRHHQRGQVPAAAEQTHRRRGAGLQPLPGYGTGAAPAGRGDRRPGTDRPRGGGPRPGSPPARTPFRPRCLAPPGGRAPAPGLLPLQVFARARDHLDRP